MKKIINIAICALSVFALSSCEKFFTRSPWNEFDAETYFRSESELKMYTDGLLNAYIPDYTETTGERRYESEDIKHDPDVKNKINFAIIGGVRLSRNFNRITVFGDLSLSGDIKPFNKESYKRKLLPLLNQKGITSRQFYVYHDSTYTIDNTVDNRKKDFAYRVITEDPKILKSETWGTVYTLHSREQAYSLLAQMQAATWDFLDENPYMRFTFNQFHEFRDRRLSEFFENLDYKRIPEFYRVYLHCYGEEYNIIIVEGTGNMMIPMEWAIIKSWKNGKVTYDKQAAKAMTPLEARSRTSEFTMTETRSFEPIDE